MSEPTFPLCPTCEKPMGWYEAKFVWRDKIESSFYTACIEHGKPKREE